MQIAPEMYTHPGVLSYKNLIYQIVLSISLSLFSYLISLPSLFLSGLNTYIHPDDVNPSSKPQSGPKLAIKRPSDQSSNQGINGFQPLSSRTSSELKQRKRVKEKFEFDETKAQIFRLKLGDLQIQSRLFYDSFKGCINCCFVSCSCFVLHKYLSSNAGDDYCDDGVVKNGTLVPIVIGVVGMFKAFDALFRVSIERSAFKRAERQLGLVFGVLGFIVALVICLGLYPAAVDFDFSSIDGFGRLFMAVLCGVLAGFLYLGAGKNARAFWLGTDQIKCNLSIVSSGWFGQIVIYANYLISGFTALLWIKPLAVIFVKKSVVGGRGLESAGLVGNVGMSEADFVKFRLCCLLLTGVLQVLTLRLNVQTFLNEAVLSWYQRLHSSTVPDMDYSRAKVFLHNHYLCLAVVQFFAPAALILASLGLSQVGGGLFDNFQGICGLLPCSALVKETALFLAWWVAFGWFLFSTSYLAIYRRGVLYIS